MKVLTFFKYSLLILVIVSSIKSLNNIRFKSVFSFKIIWNLSSKIISLIRSLSKGTHLIFMILYRRKHKLFPIISIWTDKLEIIIYILYDTSPSFVIFCLTLLPFISSVWVPMFYSQLIINFRSISLPRVYCMPYRLIIVCLFVFRYIWSFNAAIFFNFSQYSCIFNFKLFDFMFEILKLAT